MTDQILGRVRARLCVSSDRPVAQLAVRLTEVTPEGRSWLVTYGLLNLTHRSSHAAPEPLEVGQDYQIDIDMALVAHRFKPGNRLRIAISEGLWPLVWPSPEIATLTLQPEKSWIDLPILNEGEVAREPLGIPLKLNPASEPASVEIPPVVDGKVVIHNDQPASALSIPDTGTVMTTTAHEYSEITPGQADSCLWKGLFETRWLRQGNGSDPYDCAVRVSYALSADGRAFQVEESVEAFHGPERIFERSSRKSIPRDLL